MPKSLFRVATFNANSIRSRMELVRDLLAKHSPTVLCIQETKVVDELFPSAEFEAAGYSVIFRGQKSYNGVAIASNMPIEHISFDFDPDCCKGEARFIACSVCGIRILNTYVIQGNSIDSPKYAAKLEWYKKFRDYLDDRFNATRPLIWAGDLNIAPEPIDVHNPASVKNHVCFHADAQEAYRDALAFGFKDVFRKHNPGEGHFTFWDYRVPKSLERNLGWRIDHILATPPLADHCFASGIDREARAAEKPSDHTLLWADFDISTLFDDTAAL